MFAACVVLLLNSSCDRRGETAQPKACFDFVPTSNIIVGEDVKFTNCSSDALTSEWDFGDGDSSVAMDPTHSFNEPGEYSVKLVVENKNLKDEIIKKITIKESSSGTQDPPFDFDPTVYNSDNSWVKYYTDEFNSEGDWPTEIGEDYSLSISGGFYTMVDNNISDDHYGYTIVTDAIQIPNDNYDLEARIRNSADNGAYGSGLLFGKGNTYHNYFKFSIGFYRVGDTKTWDWTDGWITSSTGDTEDWNKLTIRKFEDKYFFFINEVFEFSTAYISYGDIFGFAFDQNTTVDIDWVTIYTMDFSSKKHTSKKSIIETEHTGVGRVLLAPKDYLKAK